MECIYDYLIVGSGLYGATFAYRAHKAGKRCLVIDKRNHLGGNIYCENIEGINVHKYGAHIFHTSNKKVWDCLNSFTTQGVVSIAQRSDARQIVGIFLMPPSISPASQYVLLPLIVVPNLRYPRS